MQSNKSNCTRGWIRNVWQEIVEVISYMLVKQDFWNDFCDTVETLHIEVWKHSVLPQYPNIQSISNLRIQQAFPQRQQNICRWVTEPI